MLQVTETDPAGEAGQRLRGVRGERGEPIEMQETRVCRGEFPSRCGIKGGQVVEEEFALERRQCRGDAGVERFVAGQRKKSALEVRERPGGSGGKRRQPDVQVLPLELGESPGGSGIERL